MVNVTAAPGKPQNGFGHYLRDVVYGALDGVVTTLAIVSGSAGASLEPRIGLILGMANLVADGLSMGASNYLSLKSELEQRGESVSDEMPWRHGLAAFAAFALVGAVPLSAYAFAGTSGSTFATAFVLGVGALAVIGGVRARYVGKSVPVSAAEVVAVGALAAASAFAVGVGAERLTR
jgi:VIT1/CCC1 family predicted Fe2+/Mn2+ transporter